MGALSRNKGARFEREVARRFAEALPHLEVKRSGMMQAARASNAPDVVVGGAMAIECKVGARPNVFAAIEQATVAAGEGRYAVVVAKRDREDPIVAMTLDDFLDLLVDDVPLK